MIGGIFALLSPVTSQLPPTMALRQLVSVLIVLVVCFIAGLVVRTGPGLRAKSVLDRYLLERIPGYTLLRGLAGRFTGQEEGKTFAAALVEIEDALVPAFIVEEHADGKYTVFVPSVPTPAAGTVYILERSRVHLVDVPSRRRCQVISKWGAGSEKSAGRDAEVLTAATAIRSRSSRAGRARPRCRCVQRADRPHVTFGILIDPPRVCAGVPAGSGVAHIDHCRHLFDALRLGSEESGRNLKKHGVSFDEPSTAFDDPLGSLLSRCVARRSVHPHRILPATSTALRRARRGPRRRHSHHQRTKGDEA